MSSEFVLPLKIAAGSDTQLKGKLMEAIRVIKDELVKTGYNPDEVDYTIMTHCGGRELAKLDPRQLEAVLSALRGQLQIAKKCIEAI